METLRRGNDRADRRSRRLTWVRADEMVPLAPTWRDLIQPFSEMQCRNACGAALLPSHRLRMTYRSDRTEECWRKRPNHSGNVERMAMSGGAPNTENTGQDTKAVVVRTISVGSYPWGIAFDGTNIWVTNMFGNSVTEISASNGTVLGTFTGTFSAPTGIAFDGTSIWVTNQGSASVTELLASNGTTLGSFTVGNNPIGVAFDGANLWIANQNSNTVTKLRVSDGTILGTFTAGSGPYGVVFDGVNIWITNFQGNTVSKL